MAKQKSQQQIHDSRDFAVEANTLDKQSCPETSQSFLSSPIKIKSNQCSSCGDDRRDFFLFFISLQGSFELFSFHRKQKERKFYKYLKSCGLVDCGSVDEVLRQAHLGSLNSHHEPINPSATFKLVHCAHNIVQLRCILGRMEASEHLRSANKALVIQFSLIASNVQFNCCLIYEISVFGSSSCLTRFCFSY